ncbi:MAG TPA: FTR1 family protein [Stellaceae bacterium]|nr:FTR1 family protein [Stellaceae bacterium]
MIGIAFITFREVLEAALVVTLVLAASKGTPRRGRWVAGGVAFGVVGASVVAALAAEISALLEGVGQEVFNACVLFLAVAMLGWHNVWMGRHGKEMAAEAARLGRLVLTGGRPLYALSIAVGLAVLREGSELVLFLDGLVAAGNGGDLWQGVLLGFGAGIALGSILYMGLLRIPARHLFRVTGWMILLLAAGMAAQAAAFLTQADYLPALGNRLWDTSALLSESSILGQILHVLVGYVAQPSGIQLVFYVATILIVGALMRLFGNAAPAVSRAAATALLLWAGAGALSPARADFQVRSPTVEYQEVEFEHNGDTTFDRRNSGKSNDQSYTFSIGYGVTSWWMTELEAETAAPPGENLKYDATTWENTFQLTETGEYWADLGFFFEYSHAHQKGDPESVTFGPLVQKEIGSTLHTFNLLFEKEMGSGASDGTGLQLAWQSLWRINQYASPGIEYYGEIDDLGHPGKPADQQHRIGPVVVGAVAFPPNGKIKYEVGYLFGLTDATERGAVRWKFEYEAHF